MDKINELYLKLVEWTKNNPTKATAIAAVIIAFILGAIIF